jgi:proteasome lid subunit RPN8/RPN11
VIPEPVPTTRTSLFLPGTELEVLFRHAERSYPEECCGYLVGRLTEDGTVVSRAQPTENKRRTRARDRYEISPQDLLRGMRQAKEAGEDVVGYFHSHPDTSARPSSTDTRAAWPSVSYVIVEVRDGKAGEVRSWRRSAARLVEETIVVDTAGENDAEAR